MILIFYDSGGMIMKSKWNRANELRIGINDSFIRFWLFISCQDEKLMRLNIVRHRYKINREYGIKCTQSFINHYEKIIKESR